MTTGIRTTHARAGEQSLTFSREFNAPATLVFSAHTDPDLFVHWMGPGGTHVQIRAFDARTGGEFDYVVVGDGDSIDNGWAFFGSYHQVSAPTRIVHTWEFVGEPGKPTLETLTFVDLGSDRCRLDGLSIYTSVEHCTATLEWDESCQGMDENFERLDQLLAAM